MYVLIDATNNTAIAVSDEYNALAGLSVIQYANVDCTIVPLAENKGFAQFDVKALHSILDALQKPMDRATTYPALLKAARMAIIEAPWLRFPFTAQQVTNQVATLEPAFDKPMRFNPEGAAPALTPTWHVGPQRNRRREDATYWVAFASGWPKSAPGTGGASVRPTPPPAKAQGRSARPTAPPAPGATTPAPKVRAAATGPATRPKAGTSTGRVWDICDKVASTMHDSEKALRKAIIAACEAEGINASTASVQFGKWKSSR